MQSPTTQPNVAENVIFCPRIDALTVQRSKTFYGARKLTDYGDHVEWTDGKRIWKWRLPDQAAGSQSYPVLAAILFVPAKNALGIPIKLYRVAFIAEDGHILTHLSVRNPILPKEILDKILPPEAYADLERHGVERRTEEYPTTRELHTAHPDPSLNKFSRSFAVQPALWMFGIILSIVIVVNIILLLTGYYS